MRFRIALPQAFQKCLATQTCRLQVGWAADKSDAAVSQRTEMIDRLRYTLTIVDLDIADSLADSAHIQKDQRNFAAGKLIRERTVHFRSHNRNTVHFAVDHAANTQCGPRIVIIRRIDQYVVTVLKSEVLKAVDQLRKEGIGNVGDD